MHQKLSSKCCLAPQRSHRGSTACAAGQALAALRAAFAGMAIRDCSAELEVVEVKNTCPFQARAAAPSKKGKPRRRYVLADSGPRERVGCHR